VIVRAPGKLLLSGAYVVLDGAPATVLSVARYAVANASVRAIPKAAEVLRAYGNKPAPSLDLHDLTDGQRKLGLGSSAAGLVAALAADAYDEGQELEDRVFRKELFEKCFRIHRDVQGGGSGFDVAAAVWGGFFRYELLGVGKARVTDLLWPAGLSLELYATKTSARTSEFIAQVNAFRGASPDVAGPMFAALRQAAIRASVAFGEGNIGDILEALTASREILAAIGEASEVPIVLPQVQRLGQLASAEGAVFYPSGAGGGDVCVRLGIGPSSPAFLAAAAAEGLVPLSLAPDTLGVHAASPDSEG
jgi:phosphomevalonate kinase